MASNPPVAPAGSKSKMPRTWALIAAIALSVLCSSASAQGAAPPTGKPAQEVAGTSDEALTHAVYSALNADPNYYFKHVTVSVDKGVATLSGHVDSSAAIYRARDIAGKVHGVTRVVTNHLQVESERRR
jgi:osmotically-inducible protein OsmY